MSLRSIREALRSLHDPAALERHSLARQLTGSQSISGEALQRSLQQAIDRLKPSLSTTTSSPAWRRYHLLILHYEQGLTLQETARALGISRRQASRDHRLALQVLADLLWEHLAHHHPQPLATAPTPSLPPAGEPSPALENELYYATALPDDGGTSVAPVVQSVVTTITRLLADHRVTLDLQIPDTLPPVAVSRTILRQGLINLLGYVAEVRPGAHLTLTAADASQGV
ncbi:MAG TPA: sigma-70 family RNA polymerase sigma factor, partial [Ktedonobacteraceae bacterium]|nr:sigma-70 family RNA polymerase sigma factor [Ktedonobacteraceae bacterium]